MSKLIRLIALAILVVITGLHLLSPVESVKRNELASVEVPTDASWPTLDFVDPGDTPLPCAYTWAG
jgi:hypothetical protein